MADERDSLGIVFVPVTGAAEAGVWTMETATAARERYRKDARFYAMAQAVVGRVMQEHGRVNPAEADREAYEIAVKVVSNVMEMFFREDAELKRLRYERDAYRKFAEESAGLRPMPPLIFTPLADGAATRQDGTPAES